MGLVRIDKACQAAKASLMKPWSHYGRRDNVFNEIGRDSTGHVRRAATRLGVIGPDWAGHAAKG